LGKELFLFHQFVQFIYSIRVVWIQLQGLNVPGVAVAVIGEDEVILAKGYGYRDIDKKKPMTADTLLAIGSSSKAFTTFAMGSLVDKGKLDWEEPVRTYIPWFRLYDPFASEHLTPRDLVTHRSGLPRHDLVWYNNDKSSRKELVQKLAYLKPTADLRTRFQYNNLMFLTAGYLVEVLTGKTWENAVQALGLANKNGTPLPELLVLHAADLNLGYEKDWLAEAIKQKEKGKEMDKEAREKKSTRPR